MPTITGTSGDDTLNGTSSTSNIFEGLGGNDTVTGGTGADTFHSSAGAGLDVVTDFSYGQGDRVMLDHGTAYTVHQNGSDTVVDMGNGDQLVLQNVTLTSLPSDWIMS
jgi:hypothetical protein